MRTSVHASACLVYASVHASYSACAFVAVDVVVADTYVGAVVYVEAGGGVAARAVDGVAVCDAIAAVYAAVGDVVGNTAVDAAPAVAVPAHAAAVCAKYC